MPTGYISNKFDYFNNKPSKYYAISYHYYPTDAKTKNLKPDFETSHNKTQLRIDVQLKKEYYKYTLFFNRLFSWLSQILLSFLIMDAISIAYCWLTTESGLVSKDHIKALEIYMLDNFEKVCGYRGVEDLLRSYNEDQQKASSQTPICLILHSFQRSLSSLFIKMQVIEMQLLALFITCKGISIVLRS